MPRLLAFRAADARDAPPILTVLRRDDVLLPGGKLRVEPGGAAALLERLREPLVERQQIADVFQGVVDLRIAQRPSAPVGALLALDDLLAEEAADQRTVGGGKLVAAESGGNLHVEHALRQGVHRAQQEIDLLATGVEHRHPVARNQRLPKRADIYRLGINHRRVIGRDDLHQAQLRIIGVLGDKLSVKAHDRRVGQLVAQALEVAAVVDGAGMHGALTRLVLMWPGISSWPGPGSATGLSNYRACNRKTTACGRPISRRWTSP